MSFVYFSKYNEGNAIKPTILTPVNSFKPICLLKAIIDGTNAPPKKPIAKIIPDANDRNFESNNYWIYRLFNVKLKLLNILINPPKTVTAMLFLIILHIKPIISVIANITNKDFFLEILGTK